MLNALIYSKQILTDFNKLLLELWSFNRATHK